MSISNALIRPTVLPLDGGNSPVARLPPGDFQEQTVEYSRETLKTDLQETGLEQLSRGKAIRAKCLDCCCGSPSEVARCHIIKCPLWPFRFGTNPFTTRTASEKTLEALARSRASKQEPTP